MAFPKMLKGVHEPKQYDSFTAVYWGFECCQYIHKSFHIIFGCFSYSAFETKMYNDQRHILRICDA